MTMRRVDKIALDGTCISMTFGRNEVPCSKASYADKLETAVHSNMGSQQIDARTRGTYSTEDAKVTMESVVFRAVFAPLLQRRGYGNEQIPIVFHYTHPDLGDDSDLLDGCRFTGLAQALENSNKALEVEIGIVFNQLYLTDRRVTLNVLDTRQPLQPSKFGRFAI
jgi:hypothetical protein